MDVFDAKFFFKKPFPCRTRHQSTELKPPPQKKKKLNQQETIFRRFPFDYETLPRFFRPFLLAVNVHVYSRLTMVLGLFYVFF